jgi:PHP family Zn ribbon phosphoesterase
MDHRLLLEQQQLPLPKTDVAAVEKNHSIHHLLLLPSLLSSHTIAPVDHTP